MTLLCETITVTAAAQELVDGLHSATDVVRSTIRTDSNSGKAAHDRAAQPAEVGKKAKGVQDKPLLSSNAEAETTGRYREDGSTVGPNFKERRDEQQDLGKVVQLKTQTNPVSVKARNLTRWAHSVVLLCWMSCTVESMFSVSLALKNDDGGAAAAEAANDENSSRRLLRVAVESVETKPAPEWLEVRWPSPHFDPKALACGPSGRVFVADEFRVFELIAGIPRPLTCNLTRVIADISLVCAVSECKPLVLTAGPAPEVVDCIAGRAWPLLQNPHADDFGHLAVTDDRAVLVSKRNRALEHHFSTAPHLGLRSLGAVAELGEQGLAGLDVAASHPRRLFAFRNMNGVGHAVVESLDLPSNDPSIPSRRTSLNLPRAVSPLRSACVFGEGSSALVLVSGTPVWAPSGRKAARIARVDLR